MAKLKTTAESTGLSDRLKRLDGPQLLNGQRLETVDQALATPARIPLFLAGKAEDFRSGRNNISTANAAKITPSGEALRDSETRYRCLFETAQDGILILDATTGLITDVNPLAAHRRQLNLSNRLLSFMESTAAVVIFTVLALAELVADQFPSTPSRTKSPGPIARIVLGGLSDASVAVPGAHSMALGPGLGLVGVIFGAFAGLRKTNQTGKSSQRSRFVHRSFGGCGGNCHGLFCVSLIV